jgi:hypothetical protein
MPAVTRRQYKGAAAQTTITNALASGDTSATLAATTGWPSTAGVPFFVVISPGTASEEKCSATISGSVLTLTRAQDDTTAQSHASGATIYPVFSADDADEANKLASTLTTRGDLLTMGAGPDFARIGIGASGRVLKSDGTDAAWAVDPASDLVTTKGDLLVGTAADTLARLPVGINGYRVTAASAETGGLKYDMPSVPVAADASARDALFGGAGEKVLAEGQLVYLSDLNVVQYYDGAAWATVGPQTLSSGLNYITGASFSAVTSVSFPNNTFTSTYRNYRVFFELTAASSTTSITARFRASGTDKTDSNYWQGSPGSTSAGAATDAGDALTNAWSLPTVDATFTVYALSFDVICPQVTTTNKFLLGNMFFYDNSIVAGRSFNARKFESPGVAIDSMSFIKTSGNFTGIYRVYGYSDS